MVCAAFPPFSCSRSPRATPRPRTARAAAARRGGPSGGTGGGGPRWRLFLGDGRRLEHVRGVTSVVSGYAGGTRESANYAAVSSETTGHAEAVRIAFDPAKVSYGTLLQIYFAVAHDPTQVNRQGPDIGPATARRSSPRDRASNGWRAPISRRSTAPARSPGRSRPGSSAAPSTAPNRATRTSCGGTRAIPISWPMMCRRCATSSANSPNIGAIERRHAHSVPMRHGS